MKKLLATTAIITLMSTSAFAAINSNNGNGSNNGGAGGNANPIVNPIINPNISPVVNPTAKVKNSGNADVDIIDVDIDASRTSTKQTSKQKTNVENNNGGNKFKDGDVNVAFEGDDYVEAKNPVHTAYAPTVIATSDCLGSVSGGGQGSSFGATLGFTTNSEPCNVRADANTVAALTKDEYLVKATLCQSDRIKEGFKITGEYNKYCVGAKATVKTSFFGLNKTSAYEERDVCAYPTPACKASKR
jgi:hypothetical protein